MAAAAPEMIDNVEHMPDAESGKATAVNDRFVATGWRSTAPAVELR
jgi:hypothetical protein